MAKSSGRAAWSLIMLAVSGSVLGCGSDGDGNGGSSNAVVSCDIIQAGLHYCEEFHGATSSNTGCPKGMAGFTPGNGCSRNDVAGSCSTSAYEIFFYGTEAVASAVASVCPGGTYKPRT